MLWVFSHTMAAPVDGVAMPGVWRPSDPDLSRPQTLVDAGRDIAAHPITVDTAGAYWLRFVQQLAVTSNTTVFAYPAQRPIWIDL
jgi:hypothetical protein